MGAWAGGLPSASGRCIGKASQSAAVSTTGGGRPACLLPSPLRRLQPGCSRGVREALPGQPGGRVAAQQLVVRAAVAEPASLMAEAEDAFPRGAHWEVHKFGGTCVAAPERILDAARVMTTGADGGGDRRLIVVSAMGSTTTSPLKVTDLLLNMVDKAARQDDGFTSDLEKLEEKHVDAATKLLGGDGDSNAALLDGFLARLREDIGNLKAMLRAISIGV